MKDIVSLLVYDVSVNVKNTGINTETFPVNVKINAPPVIIFSEGFETCSNILIHQLVGYLRILMVMEYTIVHIL